MAKGKAKPFDAAALHAECRAKLSTADSGARADPLSASVRALALDLLQQADSGALDLAALRALAKQISDEALRKRAARLAAAAPAGDWAALVTSMLDPLRDAPFAEIKRHLEAPRAGVVFTGHPTFALSRAMRAALGALASGKTADLGGIAHAPDAPITLRHEHDDVSAALTRAQQALRSFHAALYDWLAQHASGAWWEISPAPLKLATWVGYDLDGRTDIHWGESFRIRLEEKARQLTHYAETLRALKIDALADRLARASADTAVQAALFDADLESPDNVVAAANRLTTDTADKLSSLSAPLEELTAAIAAEPNTARRKALCVLRAEMSAFGLGVADIHLRVNASQVRAAVQADLGLEESADFFDRRAMTAAAERVASARTHAFNFAALFQERKTARRQMMLCNKVLAHIDSDRPIRFLIAEIESPATIMGALYLARFYGVDHRIDISPLFETPDALERAGRFMERLLDEPEYLDYIRARGRLCVQFGFSDSGRFMGQLAADMGIERAHILLSRALAARGVRDVDVVIFNTHGESMGRGGFPGGFKDRLDHLLTPWTRARYAHDGLRIEAEVSFQGGDGYLHFETATLADASLRAIAAWAFDAPLKPNDAFYQDINFSWDIYRGVKTWQERLFADAHYQAVLGSFAPNLLPSTGSRKTRRQSGASRDDAARSLRAIPHNAILQQLAAPANVSGGFGEMAAREPERFIDLVAASPRFAKLMEMANTARRLTSLSTLRTYANAYSPSFWTIRAARTGDDRLADAALRISARLSIHELDIAVDRLANRLSADRRKLDAVTRHYQEANDGDLAFDSDLYVLHAIRLVYMIQGFTLAAQAPAFSPRHDVTREDVLDLALELRFAETADVLEQIFPINAETPAVFSALAEPGEPLDGAGGYPEISRRIAQPLRALDAAIKEITVGVSHFYGALG